MLLTQTQQLETYRRMVRIRLFEEALDTNEIAGHLSIGQEAAIVGACMALRDEDYITGTHRSHGHPIGKGADLKPLVAEILGKVTGICKGRGGSMHLADNSVGIIGESAIVGGGLPLATGAGFSAKNLGTDQVSLCFFGDGAVNQGTFGESINMAAIWNLPVIYFCENNGYAITTTVQNSHGQPDVAKRADGFGIPGVIVDGQDAFAVYDATCHAVARARRGEGPTLIEAKTYRIHEHCRGLNAQVPYRSDEEIEYYRTQRDPLTLFRHTVETAGDITAEQLNAIDDEVALQLAQAWTFARDSAFPDPADLYDNMFSQPIHYPASSAVTGDKI